MTLEPVRQTFLPTPLASWSEVTARPQNPAVRAVHRTAPGSGLALFVISELPERPTHRAGTHYRDASRIERGCGQNFPPPTNHVPVSVLSKYEAAPSNVF